MAKKITVYQKLGVVDSQNDVIMPGAIKNKEAFITKEFDNHPIGKEIISEENGDIKAEGDIDEKYNELYPAIGFHILKSHEENGIRYIDEINLHYVGLCSQPNVDSSIKKIKDQ